MGWQSMGSRAVIPAPPPGFVLVNEQDDIPPPPPGFVLSEQYTPPIPTGQAKLSPTPTIIPPQPTTIDRVKDFVFTPVIKAAGGSTAAEEYDRAAGSAAEIVSRLTGTSVAKLRKDFPAVAFVNELARGVPEVADFLMSLGGVATAIAAKVPVLAPAVGAAFTIDLASQVPAAWEEVRKDPSAENVAKLVKTGVFTLLPGLHAQSGWKKAGEIGKPGKPLAPMPEPTARQTRIAASRITSAPEVVPPPPPGFVPVERLSRAKRRELSMPPEEGAAPEIIPMVDPELNRITTDLGLPEFSKLGEAEKTAVLQLREEAGTAPRAEAPARAVLPEAPRTVVTPAPVPEASTPAVAPGPRPSYGLSPDEQTALRISGPESPAASVGGVPAGSIEVYRASGPGTGAGNYYSTSRDFAREFTQSGLDTEVATARIPANRILDLGEGTPFAGDAEQIDAGIAKAKSLGSEAFYVDEGQGQPRSVFVVNKGVLESPVEPAPAPTARPTEAIPAEGRQLASGRAIPPKVLAEYPDLKPKEPAPIAPVAETPPVAPEAPGTRIVPDERAGLQSTITAGEYLLSSQVDATGKRLNPNVLRATRKSVENTKARLKEITAGEKPAEVPQSPEVPKSPQWHVYIDDKLSFSTADKTEAMDRAALAKKSETARKVAVGQTKAGQSAPVDISPVGMKSTALETANKVEQSAKARIAKRYKDAGTTLSAGPGLAVEQLADYALVGAAKIARGAIKFAQWSKEMVAEFGEKIRPHLGKIWMRSQKVYAEQLAEGAGGKPPAETRIAAAEMPEGVPEPKATAEVVSGPPVERPVTSPSYEKTKPNILKYVSPEVREPLERRLADYEARNPDRRVVTFQDVIKESRALGPDIVNDLDIKRMRQGETLDPAVRFAARETLNGIEEEIAGRDAQLKDINLAGEERTRIMTQRERLEQDARRLADVLIPTRSQDGRNLVYHRLMAEKSFDVTYWLARARRAMAVPDTVELPEAVRTEVETLARRGLVAERKAVDVITKEPRERRVREEAEAEVRAEIAGEGRAPKELTREQFVENKRKEIIGRLKSEIKGEQTSGADPIMPEEREQFKRDPEILGLRSQLASIRLDKKQLATEPLTRGKAVEGARSRFLARLRSQAKGKTVTVNPVTPLERELWEADPEVLSLRAKIARNRPLPAAPPELAEKMAHYKERVMKRIGEKMAGVDQARKPSKWELGTAERAQVDADPEVRAARIALSRHLTKLHRSDIFETITAVNRAGLFSGVLSMASQAIPRRFELLRLGMNILTPTQQANLAGNINWALAEGLSRVNSVILDYAIQPLSGYRTRTFAPRGKASLEVAKRAVPEMLEIFKEGATEDQLDKVDMHRELNTGHEKFDRAVNEVFRSLAAVDHAFRTYATERSLAEQMKLAKTDKPTDAMRARALTEGIFSTLSQEGLITKAYSRARGALRREGGTAGKSLALAGDLVFKVIRFPANMVTQSVAYGPGNVLKAGAELTRAMKARGWTEENQRAFVTATGRGMTGSAMMFLGYWLAANGLISTQKGLSDSSRRKVEEAAGREYGSSLRVGNRWYPLGIMGASGAILAVGATMQDMDREETASWGTKVAAIIPASIRALQENPFMRSSKDFIEAFESESMGAGTRRFVASQVASFVPGGAAHLARGLDEVRRDTKGKTMTEAVGRTVAERLPIVRETLPVRIDALGQPLPERRSALLRTKGTPALEFEDPVLREMVEARVGIGTRQQWEGESTTEYQNRVATEGNRIRARITWLMRTEAYGKADRAGRAEFIAEEISKVRAASTRKLKKTVKK